MLINTDYIQPVELTGYVRTAFADLQVNQFTLSQWLPNENIDDLDFRLVRGMAGLAETAEFRSYDAESPIGKRPGAGRISGELPPISQKIRLGEYDRLRQRRATGDVIRTAILNDALGRTRAISARMELARGDAFVNGSVTINGNGLQNFVVDYARKAGHSPVAGTVWSNSGATPIADLLSWRDTYVASTGEPPGVILTSRRVLSLLMQNASVRNLVFPGANQPSIVTQQSVASLLDVFGLPPIQVYDAQVSVNGTATRIIPDTKLLFLPAAGGATQLGRTLWGTTAESLEPEYGLAGNEPGIVAGAYSEKDPVAVWTKAAGIGLPVLVNPDLSFCATVL